jgi:hypothetical protein
LAYDGAEERIALLLLEPLKTKPMPPHAIVLGTSPEAYARHLYAALRHLDTKANALWIELPPQDSGWEAIHDRLNRCAAL